jgi:hypothetical protein
VGKPALERSIRKKDPKKFGQFQKLALKNGFKKD